MYLFALYHTEYLIILVPSTGEINECSHLKMEWIMRSGSLHSVSFIIFSDMENLLNLCFFLNETTVFAT